MHTPAPSLDDDFPSEVNAADIHALFARQRAENEAHPTPAQAVLDQQGGAAYVLALARSFPCLRGKLSHLTPETWDIDHFARACTPWSTGEYHCACFIIAVWDPHHPRTKKHPFHLIDFIQSVDLGNRRPLLAWLQSPIFP